MSKLTKEIHVEDGDRGLVFVVDVTYSVDSDGSVEVHAARPLRGYVVLSIIDQRERIARGQDKTEEFEFPVPCDAAFRKRFLQDYEADLVNAIDEILTDSRECASARVW